MPTVLEAVGLDPPQNIDGRSVLDLVRGQAPSVHDAVLAEHVDDPSTLRLKTIITPTHKLTKYQGQAFGELYDLCSDPHERVNRWDDPALATIKAQLLSRLLDELEPLEERLARQYYV